ncbi:hypothetical protein DFJ73DRAFT_963410 [Zopfochytrium polystomum]|nr:hypothetical protein DFJ73DRAFT_963410 [Zopfochytrium polystomum]
MHPSPALLRFPVAAVLALAALAQPQPSRADFVPPDWTALGFPSGKPVPITGSLAGDLFKVPIPPVADSWTNAIVALAPSPIPDIPVNGELGAPGWSGYNPKTDITNCPSNTWAISYNDGPGDLTQEYLKLLSDHNVTGTFFTIGANVVNKPQWASNLMATYNAGHQIGLHTWTHRRLTNETTEQIIAEFVWNALAVYQVIGKVPRYMRPPLRRHGQPPPRDPRRLRLQASHLERPHQRHGHPRRRYGHVEDRGRRQAHQQHDQVRQRGDPAYVPAEHGRLHFARARTDERGV